MKYTDSPLPYLYLCFRSYSIQISPIKKKKYDYGRNVVLQDLLPYVTIFQLHALIYTCNSNI